MPAPVTKGLGPGRSSVLLTRHDLGIRGWSSGPLGPHPALAPWGCRRVPGPRCFAGLGLVWLHGHVLCVLVLGKTFVRPQRSLRCGDVIGHVKSLQASGRLPGGQALTQVPSCPAAVVAVERRQAHLSSKSWPWRRPGRHRRAEGRAWFQRRQWVQVEELAPLGTDPE